MSAGTKKVALIAGVVLLVAMSAKAANNAEQVVFSTPGSIMTLSDGSTTPFGFWIWCAAGAPATSKGGYLAANACQGSMYFYAIDHSATGVIGQISEPTDGFYAANVVQGTFAQLKSGTLSPAYLCTLTNENPDAGPVHVHCFFPALGRTGDADVSNVVVNVTGP